MPFYKMNDSTTIYGETMAEAYMEFHTQERFCKRWRPIFEKPIGTIVRIEIFRDSLAIPRWTVTIRIGLLGVTMRSPIHTNLIFYNTQDAVWYLYTFAVDALVKHYIVER